MRKTLILLIALLAVPGLLYAHVYMLECSPDEDAVLTDAPKKITIVFVGSIEPAFSKIEVLDPDGKKVSGRTTFREEDTIMEADLDDNLISGVYEVKWTCMSLDGHKQKGSFKFTIS